MYCNVITLAFKNVSTVTEAVEMLENFDSLAKRPIVKDHVQNKAADMLFKLYKDEIKEVEETWESYEKRPPPMPFSHPKYGGLAIWAQSLIVRISKAKTAIENLYFLPVLPSFTESNEKYFKLRDQLESFISTTLFKAWEAEIEQMGDQTDLDGKLDNKILIYSESNTKELPPSV
jgi:hypothetical protein